MNNVWYTLINAGLALLWLAFFAMIITVVVKLARKLQ